MYSICMIYLIVMNDSDEVIARITMRLAGVLQSTRDLWVRRVSEYFNQMESLVNGQWFDTDDLPGIIRESKQAAREALEGLSNDLSSEMLHVMSGTIQRFESENTSLLNEINSLRESLSFALSGDENDVRRENENLRRALMEFPEFTVLATLQRYSVLRYNELSELTNIKKGKLRKFVKTLASKGYISIDKKSKPHRILFVSAPWRLINNEQSVVINTSLFVPSRP